MTHLDIEEKRLRRLEKRICHLTALLRLTQLIGDKRGHQRVRARVRELFIRESGRLWEILRPDDPEEAAKRPARVPGTAQDEKETAKRPGRSVLAGKGNGVDAPGCGFPVDM